MLSFLLRPFFHFLILFSPTFLSVSTHCCLTEYRIGMAAPTTPPASSADFIRTTTGIDRDSAVGIATGYQLNDRGVRVRFPVGSRIFSSPSRPDLFWGPSNLLSNGYWGLFTRGLKRPECEADHSPPSRAEVKRMWIYTSTPPYAFMA
jgi:hypothetical protein